MKIWTCDSFRGHYPIGTAAVIVANTEEQALELLLTECERMGIPQDEEDLKQIKFQRFIQTKPAVVILRDGNY